MNTGGGWRARVVSALFTVLMVCVGVQIGAALVEAVLPGLVVLACLVAVFAVLLRGSHYR